MPLQQLSDRLMIREDGLSCRVATHWPERVRAPVISALILMLAITALSCASSQPPQSPTAPAKTISSSKTAGVTDEMIGSRFPPMTLTRRSDAAEYGYSDKRPIAVGGGVGEGAHNVYRYLNALAGPQGQKLHYTRVGTCCPFETADSPIGGLLEVYEITYSGLPQATRLYFNWYGPPDPMIPIGLVAAGR